MAKPRPVRQIKSKKNRAKKPWSYRSCDAKARFEEFEAKRRAQRYGLRVYYCIICEGFHLTSKGGAE